MAIIYFNEFTMEEGDTQNSFEDFYTKENYPNFTISATEEECVKVSDDGKWVDFNVDVPYITRALCEYIISNMIGEDVCIIDLNDTRLLCEFKGIFLDK